MLRNKTFCFISMGFYAYMYLRTDGTPYYVGKGVGNRVFNSMPGHRPPKDRSRILILERVSDQDAIATEMELIRNWGRKDIGTGILHNRTAGGDGSVGYKHTAAELEKMRVTHAGRRLSPATEFTSETWKGRKRPPFSDEHRRKLSAAKKGQNVGHPNYALAVQIGNKFAKGMKHTDEWKAARSAQQKQWWADWRAKRVLISSSS